MAALSRNTASVAQDFHNAGGGVQTFNSSSIHVAEDNYKKIIIKHMKTAACVDEPWRDFPVNPVLLDTLMKRLDQTTVDSSKSSKRPSENVSSPASNPIKKEPNTSGKSRSSHTKTKTKRAPQTPTSASRKRRQVSHEKENEHIQPKAKGAKASKESKTRHSTALGSKVKKHIDTFIRTQFDDDRSPKRLKTLGTTIQTPSASENNNKKLFKVSDEESRETNAHVEDNYTISVLDELQGRNDLAQSSNALEEDPTNDCDDELSNDEEVSNIKLESSNHREYPILTPTPPATLAAASAQQSPESSPNTTYNADDSIQAQIRDKHLTRMVSKKLSCRKCTSRNRCMVLPYHTKATLLLHTLWHHSGKQYQCTHQASAKSLQRCPKTFQKKYQLQLHYRIAHRR